MKERSRKSWLRFKESVNNRKFLNFLDVLEGGVSIVLSLVMVLVILITIFDLITFLFRELLISPVGKFHNNLFTIFGLFLNVLIALEILENITAYLKKHVVQVELVIVTSLIAVARKIIILDLEKTSGVELLALAAAIVSLSASYWLIRRSHAHIPPPEH
ncbi:MAG: phosphate-starvation-inducible PsiE family protein [Scytolyngbya sp. HA4215-MV1]|nr:phosphate-starvation-inducible PsiE family protein [Scytolyngbya sp. HA4215-MV1]